MRLNGMFDRGQFTLDHVDNFQRPVGYEHDIIIPLDDFDVTLTACALEYQSKADFLFHMIGDNLSTNEINHLNNVLPDNKIVVVSFRNESNVHQMQMHPQQRAYVLNRFIPCLRVFLKDGMAGLTLTNQTIIAKNEGRKVYDHLTDESNDQGARQRGLLSKRLGLGEMDDYGWSMSQPL